MEEEEQPKQTRMSAITVPSPSKPVASAGQSPQQIPTREDRQDRITLEQSASKAVMPQILSQEIDVKIGPE